MTTTTSHEPVRAAKVAETTSQPVPAATTATSPLIVAASAAAVVALALFAIAVPLLP
ncbi:hypothetical protein [Microbacterium sp. VKM Ac-2923]|uniref:hypothetical protein n=1 Tax=Microbacterium sp. VKM Ac-2923 TaxID=2929476 RepID=UPI001FB1B890|nr:hypothetical protein [Microbacterium sp. VKM Ac-2923]MCJ1709286.1 hypothetical protein [Microbacterium sp. VKM Ac-2923]